MTDVDGRRPLDMPGEYTAGLYGRSHPLAQRALRAAPADGIVLGGRTPLAAARPTPGVSPPRVVEPMPGRAGCIPAAPEFVRAWREATARHGIARGLDEVMTSRLAPGGLAQALAITPDLTALGKCLGGRPAFSAFGGRAGVMDRFDPRRADAFPHAGPHGGPHAGTFNNNVHTVAAGPAGLHGVYTPAAGAVPVPLVDARPRRHHGAARHDGAVVADETRRPRPAGSGGGRDGAALLTHPRRFHECTTVQRRRPRGLRP